MLNYLSVEFYYIPIQKENWEHYFTNTNAPSPGLIPQISD